MGANPLTYSGLSGVGDLIVTGTSVHSRNWRAGDQLGRGEKLEDVERNMGMVIEGISTTKAAYELAQELGVYMPITQAIYSVIYQGASIDEAIKRHHVWRIPPRKRMVLIKESIDEKTSKKSCYSCCGPWRGPLPATKALAKEMLPIVEEPTIQLLSKKPWLLVSRISW